MKKTLTLLVAAFAVVLMAACGPEETPTPTTIPEALDDDTMAADADTDDSQGNEDDITLTEEPPIIDVAAVSDILGTRLFFPEPTEADGVETVVIEDMFFDLSGEIQYVVIDTGNIFDDTNRMLAIGQEDIAVQTVNDTVVFATTTTVREVETFPEIDIEALGDGVAIDDEDPANAPFAGLLRASVYEDFNLQNTEGENIADVDDLIVNQTEGRITYAVADVGGFLDIGDRTIAIPFELMAYNIDDETFLLDATEEELENAPTIDMGIWAPVTPEWDADYVDYWSNFDTGR